MKFKNLDLRLDADLSAEALSSFVQDQLETLTAADVCDFFGEELETPVDGNPLSQISRLRSQNKIVSQSALEALSIANFGLFSKGLCYLPFLIVANSTIPGAGKGLYLKGPVKITKNTIITFFGGEVCYTDDLVAFAEQKGVTYDYLSAYIRSFGCAQSAAGRVIIGDAAFKLYTTSGLGSFINHSHSSTANTKFLTFNDLCVAVVAKADIELKEGEVLELTVSYGSAKLGHEELVAIAPAFLKYASVKRPLSRLEGIEAIGGVAYEETGLCRSRIRRMRRFCVEQKLAKACISLTDQELIMFREEHQNHWRSALLRCYPSLKLVLPKHKVAELDYDEDELVGRDIKHKTGQYSFSRSSLFSSDDTSFGISEQKQSYDSIYGEYEKFRMS